MRIRLQRKGQSFLDKILSIILIAAVVVTIGALGYVIATPYVGERFTEFYVLGLEGKAVNYPKKVVVGEEGKVIVGIINREQETVSYYLEVRMDEVKNNEVELIVLEHDEKWEEIINFTPDRVRGKQKVEFLLYKKGEGEPYLKPLYLLYEDGKLVWVNIEEE